MPEGRRLFAGMNVRDNLLMGAYQRRDGSAAVRRDLDFVFGLFSRLYERRNQDASTLSGGEQQMCAIARGLMAAPRLLMIDELSLGLAPRIVEELGVALAKINATGLSILLVEQDVITALELSHHAFVHGFRTHRAQRAVQESCRTTHSSGKPIWALRPSPPGACHDRKSRSTITIPCRRRGPISVTSGSWHWRVGSASPSVTSRWTS